VSEVASSQQSPELSADLPDRLTVMTQDKAEGLFDAGDFERAFSIYRNELAPIGDKYAQYMVGYMYLTGTGVEKDPIAASAWYRLSAERGTPEFIAIRDELLRNMNEDKRSRSDAKYFQLRRQYCDLAVLLSSIKRNLGELETRTGSRIKGASNALTIIDPSGGQIQSGPEYYGALYAKLEDRLKLMQEIGDFKELNTDPEQVNLSDLERKVKERIESSDR
jgi:TPR repeat protein